MKTNERINLVTSSIVLVVVVNVYRVLAINVRNYSYFYIAFIIKKNKKSPLL